LGAVIATLTVEGKIKNRYAIEMQVNAPMKGPGHKDKPDLPHVVSSAGIGFCYYTFSVLQPGHNLHPHFGSPLCMICMCGITRNKELGILESKMLSDDNKKNIVGETVSMLELHRSYQLVFHVFLRKALDFHHIGCYGNRMALGNGVEEDRVGILGSI
jgi:hypothetical protein